MRRAALGLIAGLMIIATCLVSLSQPLEIWGQGLLTSTPTGHLNLETITAKNASQVKHIADLGHGLIRQIAWTPDHKTLVIGSDSGLWFYALDNLQPEPQIVKHVPDAIGVTFSPDGKLVAYILKDLSAASHR